ncbi:hypothetical protein [Ferruginibacter sp.]
MNFTKTENSKTSTVLIIENGKVATSNIYLTLRNTAAERFCTLSGSDDKKNWYLINDSILLSPAADEGSATAHFSIRFPASNYSFFKLTIYNNNKDPFDIQGIRKISTATIGLPAHLQPKIIENPKPLVEQKDSGSISYIKITQQQPFQFDMLSLQLSGVKYFSRSVDLYIPNSSNYSFSDPGKLLQHFTISNNSSLQFYIPLINATEFYLFIHNEDNLPLKVSSVNTSLGYRYITSYLEKHNNYKLILDNASAINPNYDLSKIYTKIFDSTPFLSFQKIAAFDIPSPKITVKKNYNWILWVSIAAALFILLLFTRKMIAEVDKRKNNDSI